MASALTKAVEVIRALRKTSTPLTLTAVAEAVGLAPSTTHSVLNDLLANGIVAQDGEKRYRLGPAVYYWGSSFARNSPIFRAAWDELVDLCNELNLVGAAAVTWDDHHLILQAHQGRQSDVGVAFGGRVPLDGGSWGKAYYAWSGAALPKKLTKFTSSTITGSADYAAEVEATQERGYATDAGEFATGVGAVAVGVTSENGYEGLVSCLGPLSVMDELAFEEVGRRLAALASRASFSLGDTSRIRLVGAE